MPTVTCLALPDRHDSPIQVPQFLSLTMVTFHGVLKFSHPEIDSSLGKKGIATPLVPMPEATVYENGSPILWQDYVRAARQISAMKPKAIPHAVQQRTDNNFGFCVLAPDPGHVPAAFFR